ncbi:hypothetical protein ACP70R_046553 [Stipagrostis hirtigluma subsp. patula]
MELNSTEVDAANKLTDDLVVEVLSKVPYKSFCRCKCVSKTWLSFSLDPHYCDKLPKPFTGGLLYQEPDSTSITFVGPSPDDGSTDTSLSFLPNHEVLELVDCCNGLVLCRHESSSSLADVSKLIVCNPATHQWIELPEPREEPEGFLYRAKLAFDPHWSPHFYIFRFKHKCSPGGGIVGVTAVETFSSESSTWFVDDTWQLEDGTNVPSRPHFFLHGILYALTADDRVLAVEAFRQTEHPNHWIMGLPGYKPSSPLDDYYLHGCLGYSAGVLYYAQPEIDGRTIVLWGLEQGSWNVKHRFSMSNAFGRDIFIRLDYEGFWYCDYDIQVVDVQKGVILIRDRVQDKLCSYSMETGTLTDVHEGFNRYMIYVPCYTMFRVGNARSDEGSSGGS